MVVTYYAGELYHHGVKNQKWGARRWQNKDGTLKDPAGYVHYGLVPPSKRGYKKIQKYEKDLKKASRTVRWSRNEKKVENAKKKIDDIMTIYKNEDEYVKNTMATRNQQLNSMNEYDKKVYPKGTFGSRHNPFANGEKVSSYDYYKQDENKNNGNNGNNGDKKNEINYEKLIRNGLTVTNTAIKAIEAAEKAYDFKQKKVTDKAERAPKVVTEAGKKVVDKVLKASPVLDNVNELKKALS